MRKNGFTIVELMTVIIVLSVIMVFAIPAITGTNRNAENKLNEIERKNLVEAGKMLAIDLDDSGSDIYNCSGWIINCDKNNGKWTSVTISVNDLVYHDYFVDNNNHLSGYQLTIRNDYSVEISK